MVSFSETDCKLQNVLQFGHKIPRCPNGVTSVNTACTVLKTRRRQSQMIQLWEWILPQPTNDQAPLKAQ